MDDIFESGYFRPEDLYHDYLIAKIEAATLKGIIERDLQLFETLAFLLNRKEREEAMESIIDHMKIYNEKIALAARLHHDYCMSKTYKGDEVIHEITEICASLY